MRTMKSQTISKKIDLAWQLTTLESRIEQYKGKPRWSSQEFANRLASNMKHGVKRLEEEVDRAFDIHFEAYKKYEASKN